MAFHKYFFGPISWQSVLVTIQTLLCFALWWWAIIPAIGLTNNSGGTDPDTIKWVTLILAALAFFFWIIIFIFGWRRKRPTFWTWHAIWFAWVWILLAIITILAFIVEDKFTGVFNGSDNPVMPSPYSAIAMQRFIEWKVILIFIVLITSFIFVSAFEIWRELWLTLEIIYDPDLPLLISGNAANRSKRTTSKRGQKYTGF